MKKTKFIYLVFIGIFFISCGRDFSVDISPLGDYNLFFEYLKNDYACRDEHSFTMEELKQKYLPEIKADDTEENLARILQEICLNELKDPHVYMLLPHPFSEIHVEVKSPLKLDYSIPLCNEIEILDETEFYIYGLVKESKEIGYIYIKNFISELGGESSLGIEGGVKKIDEMIGILIQKGVNSMILDMRSNAGGTSYIPRYIAQRFVNEPAHYMTEYYPEGNGFIKKEWTITPSGKGFRTQKIALLSNGLTGSGGEMFLLALFNRKNLIHIGSRTIGAPGNIVEKDLSNGWNFIISNSRTEYPNGKQYYKIGIIPEIIVENDSTYGVTSFDDKVIERAIMELK